MSLDPAMSMPYHAKGYLAVNPPPCLSACATSDFERLRDPGLRKPCWKGEESS
jgi:hypothetical protein